ncbi:hypothetical protein F5141DRAFT_555820 [Pisolithus sp. B1]|nr:hypothetical protein F5141DRAFT_555820 [Pisolithus sp. B1]
MLLFSFLPSVAHSGKKESHTMTSPYPSLQTVSVCLILVTVFNAFAICLTAFRLGFRFYIRRLWWDDFWAALTSCCACVCIVTTWTVSSPLDDPYMPTSTLGVPPQSRTTHVISWWMTVLSYTCAIWFARLSILSSFIRIVPPSHSHTAALAAAAVFVVMWLYVMLAKVIPCAMDRSWYSLTFIQCPIPEWVAISEVITDSLADLILVCLPLRLLWRLRVPSDQRAMILAVFSSSILTSIVSVIHTAYTIPPSFIGGVTANIEAAVNLVVCNLLVLVTFIYRIRRNGRNMGTCDKDFTGRLTTIELGFSGSVESCPTANPATGSDGGTLGITFTKPGVADTIADHSSHSLTTQAYPGISEKYLSIFSNKHGVLSAEQIELSSPAPSRTPSSSLTLSWPPPPPPKCSFH